MTVESHKRIRKADDFDGSYAENGYVMYDEKDREGRPYDESVTALYDVVTGKIRVYIGNSQNQPTVYFDNADSLTTLIEMLETVRQEAPRRIF